MKYLTDFLAKLSSIRAGRPWYEYSTQFARFTAMIVQAPFPLCIGYSIPSVFFLIEKLGTDPEGIGILFLAQVLVLFWVVWGDAQLKKLAVDKFKTFHENKS